MAISQKLAKAVLELSTDLTNLEKGWDKAEQTSAARAKAIGKTLTSIGKTWSVGLTAPIVGVGATIFKLGNDFDEALDTIRAGTGATGAALEGFGNSYRTVFAGVLNTKEEVATAIADLNTRTGATGQVLDNLATNFLNLAQITKQEVAPLIAQTTASFGQFGIAADQQSAALDFLFKVTQSTGIGFADLNDQLVKYGPTLRELGFGLNESAALLGQWDKQGVDTRKTIAGLQTASLTFARQNVSLKDGLAETVAEIQRLGPGAESGTVALKVFGSNGLAVRDAILAGALSVNDLTAALQGNTETIGTARSDTDDFKEKLTGLWRTIEAQLMPVGLRLIDALTKMTPQFEAVASKVASLIEWFANLSPQTQAWIGIAAGVVAAIGPLLIIVGQLVAAIAAMGPIFTAAGVVIAAITSPIGIAVGAIIGLYEAWKHWDQITAIAKAVYDGVKAWLVDKFEAVVKWIGDKVDKVKGFFSGLYDAVIGHSYVPDLVNGIGVHFGRLDSVMVTPTRAATASVGGLFGELQGTVMRHVDGLMGKLSGKLTSGLTGLLGGGKAGGGLLGGLLSTGLSSLLGPAGPLSGLISSGISALGNLAVKGLQKMWGGLKHLFGGPSGQELAGRDVEAQFEQSFGGMEKMLNALHDAGLDATAEFNRLMGAEKQGAGAVQSVIDSINAKLAAHKQALDETADASEAAGQAASDAGAASADSFARAQQAIVDLQEAAKVRLKEMAESGDYSADEIQQAQKDAALQIKEAYGQLSDLDIKIPVSADLSGFQLPDLSAFGIQLPQLPAFDIGTPNLDFANFRTGIPAMLHGQEAVIPRGGAHQLAAEIAGALGHGGGGSPMIVQLVADGRKLAEVAVPHIPGVIGRWV